MSLYSFKNHLKTLLCLTIFAYLLIPWRCVFAYYSAFSPTKQYGKTYSPSPTFGTGYGLSTGIGSSGGFGSGLGTGFGSSLGSGYGGGLGTGGGYGPGTGFGGPIVNPKPVSPKPIKTPLKVPTVTVIPPISPIPTPPLPPVTTPGTSILPAAPVVTPLPPAVPAPATPIILTPTPVLPLPPTTTQVLPVSPTSIPAAPITLPIAPSPVPVIPHITNYINLGGIGIYAPTDPVNFAVVNSFFPGGIYTGPVTTTQGNVTTVVTPVVQPLYTVPQAVVDLNSVSYTPILGGANIIISSPYVTIYGPNGELLSGTREAALLARLGLGPVSYQNLGLFPLLSFNPLLGLLSGTARYQLGSPLPPILLGGFFPGLRPFGLFPRIF